MSRDSQRGTFLSRAVLASTGSSGLEGGKNDYELHLLFKISNGPFHPRLHIYSIALTYIYLYILVYFDIL